MQENCLLELRGIEKLFPGVKALNNVDFTLRKGEIHALMGENGAGKSTLIKILTGVYPMDAGSVKVEGEIVHINSPQDAQNNGISTVYQEITLCPNLTVAENMFIGRDSKLLVNQKAYEKKAEEILNNLQIPARARQQLGNCSLAVQQMVAIARAVDMQCKVLILDEPTSSLDDKEVNMLFTLMRDLKSRGVGIIFVTHFLEQVYAVCDTITVLRNGEFAGEYTVEEMPRVKLVAAMLGKDFDDLASIKKEGTGTVSDEVIVEASGLSHKGTIKPFDFKINKGEVVGVTGLLGSGRSEMVRCIYGADRAQTGTLKVKGNQLNIKEPLDAIKNGMGYLPDDRKADGCIGDLSVRENIILALQARNGMFKKIPVSKQIELADKFINMLQIKTASRETPINQLSGGNQQKVILARWLCTHPDFLILDEPTRGIDIGTKTEFQKLALKFAEEEGMSIVFISSEIEEMLRTCTRMYVMRDGAQVGEISGEMTQESVMAAIAGGGE